MRTIVMRQVALFVAVAILLVGGLLAARLVGAPGPAAVQASHGPKDGCELAAAGYEVSEDGGYTPIYNVWCWDQAGYLGVPAPGGRH